MRRIWLFVALLYVVRGGFAFTKIFEPVTQIVTRGVHTEVGEGGALDGKLVTPAPVYMIH